MSTEAYNSRTHLHELDDFSWESQGILAQAREFVAGCDMRNRAQWAIFVEQFRTQPDGGGSWRGEYWGKMMRGATLTYRSTRDEVLYDILTESVRDLLTTQEASGRISTYPADNEFHGWDMWCRKYVMLGLEYYLDICRDQALREEVIHALCRHADYILDYVGSGEGQMSILATSNQFGAINSSSILEPMVWLYSLTQDSRYLDFATYIIESGGCTHGNIFQMALEGKLYPYQYGVTKAYEMISCFEGVLAYYRITGNEDCRRMVLNFYQRMRESDVTLIGCCGTEGELLNHATAEQSNPAWVGIMQETCVTVTWMKFCYQVLRLTGDSTIADALECSAYNAMLGSIKPDGTGAPFDSYSPLLMDMRGQGRGGAQFFDQGGSYGCCEAIGAAGTALSALAGTMRDADGLVCNLYEQGCVKTATPSGKPLLLQSQTKYPVEADVCMTVRLTESEVFAIKLRIPAWSEQTTLRVNGEEISVTPGSYATLQRAWNDGDVIELTLDLRARVIFAPTTNGDEITAAHVAILRGPIILARDARLGESLLQAICLSDGTVKLTPTNTATFPVYMEFSLTDEQGNVIHLIDYASTGKTYDENSLTTVWLPTEEYWRDASFEGVVLLTNAGTGKRITADATGYLIQDEKADAAASDDAYLVAMELQPSGFYAIRLCATGCYLTVNSVGKVTLEAFTGGAEQLFRILRAQDGKISVISKRSGGLLGAEKDTEDVYVRPRDHSPLQQWRAAAASYQGGTLDISAERGISVTCGVPLRVFCLASERFVRICAEDARLIKGPDYRTIPQPTPYAWAFEDAGDGRVRIRLADGRYLTAKENTNKLYATAKADDALQYFELQKKAGERYYVINVATGMLISESGEDDSVHLYPDCHVDAQVWVIAPM